MQEVKHICEHAGPYRKNLHIKDNEEVEPVSTESISKSKVYYINYCLLKCVHI